MNRLQKLLIVLVVAELIGVLWVERNKSAPTPAVRWEYHESLTREDVIRFEAAYSGSTEDRVLLARIYWAAGLLPQAEWVTRPFSNSVTSVEGAYLRAQLLDALGKLPESRALYSALRTQGDQAHRDRCDASRGLGLLRLNQIADALSLLTNATTVPRAQLVAARVLIRGGRAGDALPLLDRVEQLNGPLFDTIQLRSWAQQELQDNAEAERLRVLAESYSARPALYDPAYGVMRNFRERLGVLARLNRATALERAGDVAAAEKILREALQALWTEEFALPLARLKIGQGNNAEAEALMKETEARNGFSPAVSELMGDMILPKDPVKAVAMWQRGIALDPRTPLLERLARAAGSTNSSYLAELLYLRGREAFINHRLDQASAALREALELRPTHAETLFYLGSIEELREQRNEAERFFRECIKHAPNHGKALRALRRLSGDLR